MSSSDPSIIQVASFKCRADVPLSISYLLQTFSPLQVPQSVGGMGQVGHMGGMGSMGGMGTMPGQAVPQLPQKKYLAKQVTCAQL